MKLGVNIDHIATLRQARQTNEPDPVAAAAIAERAGADGITIHLREDRRHIQDRDLAILRQTVTTRLNLEMGLNSEIIDIALRAQPDQVTLVPERRQEITTEGGLDAVKELTRLKKQLPKFRAAGIRVSLFIEPTAAQIAAAAKTGAEFVEFHTGAYANAYPHEAAMRTELNRLVEGVNLAFAAGLRVNAGHGLTYHNVAPIAAIPAVEELNIGHSIVARAVLTGLDQAVREMKALLQ
ncbi:pyridoxine 5'-phosphate synthase [Planctomycetales bacterium]|nr:pyridoxine 5'-phosphate synthase [Planctomycetales bacterium]GHT02088.1 pyridoxine 5'-phosphate synthase [Planctomycetales bacterium]GHT07731.1 pyridoxine 5'-phosphate synthase [Planctomycetales bacterium]GHV22447.1 pyridoxine 5'-phosphate synthase [Planctomycetales bacterium]